MRLTDRLPDPASPDLSQSATALSVKPRGVDGAPGLPQIVSRRLDVARIGLAELRRCLGGGTAPGDAALLLDKLEEDLSLLQRRLTREAAVAAAADN